LAIGILNLLPYGVQAVRLSVKNQAAKTFTRIKTLKNGMLEYTEKQEATETTRDLFSFIILIWKDVPNLGCDTIEQVARELRCKLRKTVVDKR